MLSSYKNRKKIDNSPEQWRVFENTHEAIIDKETFEIVQKIRFSRKTPPYQNGGYAYVLWFALLCRLRKQNDIS